MKFYKSAWFSTFLIGVSTTILGVFLGWYLTTVYNQPRILWYSRPYYKTANESIGNMFLWNDGGRPDHNITVVFDSDLDDKNIKIVDLTSTYEVKHSDNKTIITLKELKPGEGADITFKDDPKKDDIFIDGIFSENSKIVEVPFAFEPKGWQLPWVLDIFIVVISLVLGAWFGSFFTKRAIKKERAIIVDMNN